MAENLSYHERVKRENTVKLREMEGKLPGFLSMFFRGMADRISARTMVAYAYDLQIFFHFLNSYLFDNRFADIHEMPLSILAEVSKTDIEDYMEYLSYYTSQDGTEHSNDERGKSRKLSALKSMYNYFYESELIKANPTSIVHVPKIHEKNIIHLEADEVAKLLDLVENGSDTESKQQKNFHNKTMVRDLCLLTLLLGTGIRVSECVGLDIKDVDFDNGAIRIVRKGGNESRVYFGEEVEDALLDYLEERSHVIPLAGHENALFLSIQNRRITVRAVEKLVKKYASQVTTLKKITPHKLRSTYGTELYRESGDIYLVATVLGHKDVNTTRRHYASMDDEQRRKAAKYVKLRKED